jgi:hypothetical protein
MSKQGCDNNCTTCSSANHAYCALVIAKTNQSALVEIMAILQAMRETKIYTPMQEGETEVSANNKQSKT